MKSLRVDLRFVFRMAGMLIRYALALALLNVPVLASAQIAISRTAVDDAALSGHYVGTAISKTGQSIPLSLDITFAKQRYSGAVTTAFGVFTLSGEAPSGSSPLVLTLSGESGQGTLTLPEKGAQLNGVYTLADDSGTVSLHRTSQKVQTAEASSASLKTPILFLGVYHMANPELDAVRFVADDVLTPVRQQQIKALVARLQQFRPTKVLVEAPYSDPTWQQRYEVYLHGDAKLSPNEIEQLGFRIAKAEHLPQIGCIDYQMFLNGLRPDEIRLPEHSTTGPHPDRPSAAIAPTHEEEALRQMTISQYLTRLNSPESLSTGESQYMSMLLPNQQPDLYAGADQVANWYRRNLRIFENINRFSSPGDRVLVIIGAGHIPLLKEFAAESFYFKVVDPLPFLAPTTH